MHLRISLYFLTAPPVANLAAHLVRHCLSTPGTRKCSMAATLHKHKTSNVDEVAVVDLEEGLFCLHVEAAALLSPSFKQTARRGSLMRKPSGKSSHTTSAEYVPAFPRSHTLARLEHGLCFLSRF